MCGRRGSRLQASVAIAVALVPAALMPAACGGANTVTTSQDAMSLPAPTIGREGSP
jgi:hypothetical protein